jgi:hypothetical protein
MPSEHDEAVALVEWCHWNNIDIWHLDQEMWTPSWSQKRKAKQEGVKSGVSDYLIYLSSERRKNKSGLLVFLELKKRRTRKKTGEFRALSSDGIDVKDSQVDFLEKMKTVEGVEGGICFGCDEAVAFIQKFLK